MARDTRFFIKIAKASGHKADSKVVGNRSNDLNFVFCFSFFSFEFNYFRGLEQFIRNKYEKKLYVSKGGPPPPRDVKTSQEKVRNFEIFSTLIFL